MKLKHLLIILLLALAFGAWNLLVFTPGESVELKGIEIPTKIKANENSNNKQRALAFLKEKNLDNFLHSGSQKPLFEAFVEENASCESNKQVLPKYIQEKACVISGNLVDIYKSKHGNFYSFNIFEKPTSTWYLYQDNKLLLTAKDWRSGTGHSPFREMGWTDGKLSFTVQKTHPKDPNQMLLDVWIDGAYLQQHFKQYTSIKTGFSHKGKIGFIGHRNGKDFLVFNNIERSTGYDDISITACCAVEGVPLDVYENDVLHTIGIRNGTYHFIEATLN